MRAVDGLTRSRKKRFGRLRASLSVICLPPHTHPARRCGTSSRNTTRSRTTCGTTYHALPRPFRDSDDDESDEFYYKNEEAERVIRVLRAARKEFYELKPVKDGRSHRKACTECGYKKWEEGDFYVVDTRQLYDQEKLCLDCAEDRFCDLGTDNSDLDCYDGYFSESEGYDAEDIRPHPETGLNADGEIPDRLLSSRGWEYWPVVRSGQYGLVFVVSKKAFGYYDDDDDDDGRVVYFDQPLLGGCCIFKKRDLRQPPFHGTHQSLV